MSTETKSQNSGKVTCSNVTTPALLDRFEYKYTIPISMVDSIVDFISPYCSHDKYSALSPDRYYRINSLYFDTPDYLFLRQRMLKVEKRFNMRIRSYTDTPSFPYFFEIKQRIGDIVRKTRARVDDPDYEKYFFTTSYKPPEGDDLKNDKHRDLFYHTFYKYNARPVVLVQYRRQAFFSNYDEYARVTFDKGLRYMIPNGYQPKPIEQMMIPCDVQTGPENKDFVILELKCYTSFVPIWMVDLVRAFNLQRVGFSKFSTCLRPVLTHNSTDGLLRNPSSMCKKFYMEDL